MAGTQRFIRTFPQIADLEDAPMEPITKVSTTIDAPPREVWDALTTPDIIKSYFFGSDVESDWEVGSPITFRGEYQGKKYEDKGVIQAAVPGKRLAYSHWSPLSGVPDRPENYNLVTFDLSDTDDGTKVTLSQAKLSGAPKQSDLDRKDEFEKNWKMVLSGLKKAVEH